MNGYVLDTHAWIWLLLDDPRLDSQARKALLRGGERNRLFVAAISVWELALLEAAGRYLLNTPENRRSAARLTPQQRASCGNKAARGSTICSVFTAPSRSSLPKRSRCSRRTSWAATKEA